MNDVTRSRQWTPLGSPARAAAIALAMAALVAVTIASELSGDQPPSVWLLTLDIVLGAAGALATPFLARWPLAGAVAFGVLSAVSPAMSPLAGNALLWLALCRPLRLAVAVGVFGVGAQVLRALWRPVALPLGWWVLLLAAIYAAMIGWGAMAQARRAVLASLRERARRAEEQQEQRVAEARRAERTRIAREMHDVLAHRLSLLAAYAGALEYRPDAPAEDLARAAGVIRDGAHEALEELREVIGVLRDDTDDPSGAADDARTRPQPTLADLPRLVEESRDAGVDVTFDTDIGDPSAVPAGTGRTAYRVVQEALTNARKHAEGQPVRLSIRGRRGGEMIVDVRNPLPDGHAPAAPGGGRGLVGMAERVDLAGGSLRHGPSDGEFRLRATLPWPTTKEPTT